MFVGKRMTRNVITVEKDTTVLKVRNLLREHNIDQVPVVEGKKLVGIITDKDIRQNAASPATTLAVHELNYLLSEMKAKDIMTRNLITVSPGTTIEEAALLINDKRINSLPVVLDGELVGIITTCDLLYVLLEFIGVDLASSRVEVIHSRSSGEIAKLANIVNGLGLTILSIVSTVNREGEDSRTTLIRVNTDDNREVTKALEDAGYEVTNEYRIVK